MKRGAVIRLCVVVAACSAAGAVAVMGLNDHARGTPSGASSTQANLQALAAASGGGGYPYVISDHPGGPTNLRDCPHEEPEGAPANECPIVEQLPYRTNVIMRCWVSTVHPADAKGTSKKWFYVNDINGSHPGYSGYVFSDYVTNQTPGTPGCTDAIIAQYQMPKYVPPPPLSFKVVGSCTTAGGTLTGQSANFTPGASFEVSAAYPNGKPYPLAKTSGTISSSGTVNWTWPCAGDPPGEYSTDLLDLGTGQDVTAYFNIGPAPAGGNTGQAPVDNTPPQQNPQPPVPSVNQPGPPAPQPAPSAPPAPPPAPPTTRGLFIEDDVYGGTWARTDPNNGTWYAKSNRPPNAAYWYPNGLGVAVDCTRVGASYDVVLNGAHQTWAWWAHVTDGKWVPVAVFRDINSDGDLGLNHC